MSEPITLFTSDELAAMAERERAATPGWSYHPDEENASMGWILGPKGETIFIIYGDSAQQEINAECAVKARNEYARLLAVAQLANEAVTALEHAKGEIQRIATDGGGFSCTVIDDIDALLARLTPQEKEKST